LRGQEGKSFRRAPYSTPNRAAKAAISGIFAMRTIPKSGHRFSGKIMRKQ
jgi:hypothetical protein